MWQSELSKVGVSVAVRHQQGEVGQQTKGGRGSNLAAVSGTLGVADENP